jgi:hypothetical protein
MPKARCVRKKRGLFNSQVWRFKVQTTGHRLWKDPPWLHPIIAGNNTTGTHVRRRFDQKPDSREKPVLFFHKNSLSRMLLAHNCNPSYSGGETRKIVVQRQPRQVVCKTLSGKKKKSQKKGW